MAQRLGGTCSLVLLKLGRVMLVFLDWYSQILYRLQEKKLDCSSHPNFLSDGSEVLVETLLDLEAPEETEDAVESLLGVSQSNR
jgi:hypothetical protein